MSETDDDDSVAYEIILGIGGHRFGPPSAAVQAAVRGITDPQRFARVAAHLLLAFDWDDLLATP
jgi:hypothetical protein